MANLVSPGYNNSALVNQLLSHAEDRILEFKGLNRRDFVEEGEMSDMKNLTSDNYPLLTPRKLRGTYALPEGVTIPLRIMARYNKIAMIAKDGNGHVNFYFDGQKVTEVTGLDETSDMVAINTKICFFPQKTCISVTQSGGTACVVQGSFSSLEEYVTIGQGSPVTVTVSNEDARIALSGSHNFVYDDALSLTGTLSYKGANNITQTKSCSVGCIVEGVSGNTLILPRETFIELTGEGATDITFFGIIGRTIPAMDMVIEWNNRLWGASSAENTIYACKLGDPKNWQYYQGTALDSFYAQQGTDGIWTGCATYSNHIIFFKQNSMARIYGSAPSNFQVTNTKCYGVEEGSRASVVTINDQVFYKSVIGIMAYDGGTPYCISEKFNKPFKAVVAGTEGRKYYASIITKDVGPELMVLDIDKAIWHKEDSTRFEDTCSIDDKLYFVTYDTESLTCSNDVIANSYLLVGEGEASEGTVHVVNPVTPTETYEDMEWSATFGPFDEFSENRKIYSKLLMRLVRKTGTKVDVYISINEGEWEKVYTFDPAKTGGDFIPIIPRRCDRYSVKIVGHGDCSVKSLTRSVRMGTGGRL